MAELVSSQPPSLSLNDRPTLDLAIASENETSLSNQPESSTFSTDPATVAVPSSAIHAHGVSLPQQNVKSHKRSRTSINKLPTFSFNPGASGKEEDHSEQTYKASTPLPSPESPSKGRHRRSASELVGGHGGLKSSHSSPVKIDHIAPVDGILHAFGSPPPSQRHKHRRSEVRALAEPLPAVLLSRAETLQSDHGTLEDGAAGSSFCKNLSPQADNELAGEFFAEGVEIAPRPLSEVSDGSASSSSTLKEACNNNTQARGRPTIESHNPSGLMISSDRPSLAIQASEPTDGAYQHNLNRSTVLDPYSDILHTPDSEFAQLDVNFDEDPTSTVVIDDGSGTNRHRTDAVALRSINSTSLDDSNESGVIDLDLAMARPDSGHDHRNPYPRSFQSARRSMHSSGALSGFMGPGMRYHRRTESAPLLAPATFERQFDGSATEKGFEMENVFEEEEEEDHDEEVAAQNATRLSEADALSQTAGSESDDPPSRYAPDLSAQVGADDTSSGSGARSFALGQRQPNDACEDDYALTPPQAPFMTPDTPSNSSFSSQRYPGWSERSSGFGQSADDVPSLVSGSSTVGSGVPWHCATGSPRSPAPGSSASTSTLAKPDEQRRRKRASVVSLSRLIGGSYSEDRAGSSPPVTKRCQSSDGIHVMRKKGAHRLSKLFKFWKSKDEPAG